MRLVVSVDGSTNADLAVEQVGLRNWPKDSEIRVVVVDQPFEPTLVGDIVPLVRSAVEECNKEENTHARQLAETAAQRLRTMGFPAEGLVKVGDPKRVLIEFAEEWGADCIFLGATGLSNRVQRFLLGSVAGAVAARAHCSVEIVRQKQFFTNHNNGNGTGK